MGFRYLLVLCVSAPSRIILFLQRSEAGTIDFKFEQHFLAGASLIRFRGLYIFFFLALYHLHLTKAVNAIHLRLSNVREFLYLNLFVHRANLSNLINH